LGVGVNKHKTNNTGKIAWTGITRHVKADQDAFAALADLLAHEIAIQSFRLINMLESADPHDGHELWNSRIFFPNSDKTGQQRVQQLTDMNKVTKGVSGWDKDKRTGLLRKTATGIGLGAGADADGLNRHMGWKPDTQSRSYAVADLAAHLQEQAGLAGFDCHNDIWRHNHHLGRDAVAVDVSWCDTLLHGLSRLSHLSNLSARRQEVLQCIQKLAQAYWQALPINILKYGMKFVQGLPNVVRIMQMPEYAFFSDKVRQAECDSMEKLQIVQEVPYLEEWNRQQPHHVGEKSQQVAHHAESLSTAFSETREQSQVRSAEAAGVLSQEPLAKRQRVETNAADMREQELQAELDQLKSQWRQKKLQLQIDTQKQAILELDQHEEKLKRRQNAAQHGTLATQASLALSTSNCDVQPSNSLCTPFTLYVEDQTELPSSNAEGCTVPAPQSNNITNAPKNPDFFQSQTIAGRYQEWIGGGHRAGIKSQLVMKKSGSNFRLGLPGSGHTEPAVDNLRKKRDLPEAVEQLVLQGLSSDAAVALVTKVVNDFGLKSISDQSEAFRHLARDSAARAETRMMSKTGKTVKQFKIAYDLERSKALDGQAM